MCENPLDESASRSQRCHVLRSKPWGWVGVCPLPSLPVDGPGPPPQMHRHGSTHRDTDMDMCPHVSTHMCVKTGRGSMRVRVLFWTDFCQG